MLFAQHLHCSQEHQIFQALFTHSLDYRLVSWAAAMQALDVTVLVQRYEFSSFLINEIDVLEGRVATHVPTKSVAHGFSRMPHEFFSVARRAARVSRF